MLTKDKIDIELFFKYLEENALDKSSISSILEVSPSLEESLSIFLHEKFNDLYRQFLVSKKFEYDNSYNVDGVLGYLSVNEDNTKIIVPKTIQNDEHFRKGNFIFRTYKYKVPEIWEFDTLLVRGMQEELLSYYMCNIDKLFGDVVVLGSPNYKGFYEAIVRLINQRSSDEYILCHDVVSDKKRELYLVKKRENKFY